MVFPLGIGEWIHRGVQTFAVRVLIVALTFVLSSISFVGLIRWIGFLKPATRLQEFMDILLVTSLAASPWTCYHVVRITLRPVAADIYEWPSKFFNVDVMYVLLYGSGMFAISGVRAFAKRRS